MSAREADRGALGRRRRGIPGRKFSAWSEWNGSTGTPHATSGGARARLWPSSATGSPEAPTSTRERPGSPQRASISSPRTTGSRCAISCLQREAQRGQRGGEPRRREPQPVLERRGRRVHRQSRGERASRASDAQLSGHAAALPGCADDSGGDEIGRTQQGNNNVYSQDNVMSWGTTGTTPTRLCCSSPGASCACGTGTPCSAAAAGSRGGRSTGARSATSDGSHPAGSRCPRTTGAPARRSRSASS